MKPTKAKRKLGFHSETVRRLSYAQLAIVGGGNDCGEDEKVPLCFISMLGGECPKHCRSGGVA